MNKKIIAIALLLAGMFWSCEDKIVDNDIEEGIRVEIISPKSDVDYHYYESINFEAILIVYNDTLDYLNYDEIEWTTGENDDKIIGTLFEAGNYSIRCTITKDSVTYSSSVNISVKNFIKLDTLLISNNLQLFQIPNIDIYTIGVDNNNKIILGTTTGLFYQDNNTWENINYGDGLLENMIQSIGVSNDNIIHFGYWRENGISKLMGNSIVNIEMDNSLGGDVHNITFDSDNNIWAATHRGKIVQYVNNSWKSFEEQPINLGQPNTLLFDNNGILFGASSDGCVKYNGINWEIIQHNGEPLKPWHFSIDNNGTMWSYHGSRIVKLSITDTTVYSYIEFPFLSGFISEIKIDINNNLWLSTENGLIKFDGTSWERIQMPISDNVFFDLVIDSENKIWFCGKTIFGYYKE